MEFPRCSALASNRGGAGEPLSASLPLCKMEIMIEPISNDCPSAEDWMKKYTQCTIEGNNAKP